jgi:pimeloyl-ACP methyl ester carboxylesterase
MQFVKEGLGLDYEIFGEGRSLVLLHGLALDRALLRDAIEPVFTGGAERTGWRRIYVDLPGHGQSTTAAVTPSADGLIAALRLFVTEVAGDGVCLAGHAYGGYLAQGLVASEASFGGLFLVCPVVEPDLAARRVPPQRFSARDETLVFTDDAEREIFNGEVSLQTAAVLEGFRKLVAPAHASTDRTFLGGVRSHYVSSLPLRSAARDFAQPTALLCGRNDHWVGFLDAAELAAAYPRASLAVLPDCGQLLPLENPAALRAAFVDWLERVEKAV